MRNAIYFYACLGISVLFTGCGEEIIHKVGVTGSLRGTVNGFVSGTGSSVLADAEIVLEGSDPLITLRTASNGKFETELVTGTYNLVISKPGYGTYKILGYSFVGGDNQTIIPPVTIYKLPTILIKDASVTATRYYNTVSTAFTVINDTDDSQAVTYGQYRYFLSTEADVSPANYQDTGILGGYYQAGSQTFYKNFSADRYPAGTNFYVIIYPCIEAYLSYLDLETGKEVFASMGESKSAILKITVPN
jgi:hypothetical protein